MLVDVYSLPRVDDFVNSGHRLFTKKDASSERASYSIAIIKKETVLR